MYLGPPSAHEVGAALMLLAENWQESNARTRPIPIAACLAEAWHPLRLARCIEKREAGMKAKPIVAVGLRLPDRPLLYTLSDGNHRVSAAKLDGKTMIAARVTGYWQIEPRHFTIAQHALWRLRDHGMQHVADLTEMNQFVLVGYGVRTLAAPAAPANHQMAFQA